MRNIMYKLFAVFALLFLLVACNNTKYKKELENIKESASSTSKALEDEFKDYVYDPEKAQKLCASGNVIAEDGYYVIIGNILNKYNIQGGVLAPLCSKTNCNHISNTCDAYINKRTNTSLITDCQDLKLLHYNNKLYCVEIDETLAYTLYKYNMTFSDKKKVAELANKSKTATVIVDAKTTLTIIKDYLYYVVADADYDKIIANDYMTKYTLCRVNLSEENAQPEMLYSIEEPADSGLGRLGFTLTYNNEYVVLIYNSTSRMNASDRSKVYYTSVVAYSYETGDCKMLYNFEGNEIEANALTDVGYPFTGTCYLSEDNDLFYENFEYTDKITNRYYGFKGIGKYNLITGEFCNVYKTEFTKKSLFTSDGENIYFFECSETPGFLDSKVYVSVINMSGDMVNRVLLKYDEGYYNEEKAIYDKYKSGNIYMDMVGSSVTFPKIQCLDDRYIIVFAYSQGLDSLSVNSASFERYVRNSLNSENGPLSIGLVKKSELLSGDELNIKQIFSYE